MSITFKLVAHGDDDYVACVKLREDILRIPLGLTFTEEEMAAENGQIHVAGIDVDGVVCATCALVPKDGETLKMQRVAVAEGRQGQGLGGGLASFCHSFAREKGYAQIVAHARHTAVPFYLKHGYVTQGEPFDEQGIPHILVVREIG